MTTFLYSATAAADGYIAGPGGDMSWLLPFTTEDPDPIFERIIPQITALLTGRTTYDGDDPHAGDPEKEGAFEGQWDGPQVVLTHRPVTSPPPGLTVTHTLQEAEEACRAAAGAEGTVNVLGADIARQCLEAGILNEVIISTVPILLGGGTPILRGTERSFTLDLIDQATTTTGHTRHYRVRV